MTEQANRAIAQHDAELQFVSGDSGPSCEEIGVTCRAEGHDCVWDLFPGDGYEVEGGLMLTVECSCCSDQEVRFVPKGDRQEGSGILLPTCVLCGLESNRPCRCGFALHDNEGSVEGTYCATALVLHHRFVEYGQPKGDRQEGSP